MSDALVIFLHGVGSSGASLAPLARVWADVLPNAAFAAPLMDRLPSIREAPEGSGSASPG